MQLREYCEQQLRRLQRNLAEALSTGSVESVHQTRVASRRLEEPLELCRPWASDRKIDRTLKRLQRVRKALRDVREFDVLRESIAPLPQAGLEAEEVRTLDAELLAERARQWRRAQQKADTVDGQTIERMVGSVLQEMDSKADDGPEGPSNRMASLTAARAEDVLRHPPRAGESLDLHLTRVRLKRLRYVVELKQALAEQKAEELIRVFKLAQDQLGNWNDQLQAVAHLAKLARRRRVMIERPEFAAHLLAYAAGRLERAREIADAFLVEWPALSRRLADLVGVAAAD